MKCTIYIYLAISNKENYLIKKEEIKKFSRKEKYDFYDNDEIGKFYEFLIVPENKRILG